MAIPPEPIDELLPLTDAAVIAKVTKILHQGKQDFIPNPKEEDAVDIPRDLPDQLVTLSIKKVLFGDFVTVNESFNVIKPAGDYVLREGVEGPFLIYRGKEDKEPVIAGRYGLDTYPLFVIEDAILRHKSNI